MCGIIYHKNFRGKNVGKSIRKQYFKQRDRGMDGFGFVAIKNNKAISKRELYEHEIMRDLKHNRASEIMFHHRFPTSTRNTVQTAHPIATRNKKYRHNYYLVHNGVIFNDAELLKEHSRMGIKYNTRLNNDQFNDSEALLHELALSIEGIKDSEEINTRGSVAFVLLQTDKRDKPVRLFWGKNYGSPLKMDYVKGIRLALSSEGHGVDVVENKLYSFNYGTQTIDHKNFTIPYTVSTGYQGVDDRHGGSYDVDDYDEDEVKEIRNMTDEQVNDYLEALYNRRELLLKSLTKAQRESDYDTEQEIQEEIDEVEDSAHIFEGEINERSLAWIE